MSSWFFRDCAHLRMNWSNINPFRYLLFLCVWFSVLCCFFYHRYHLFMVKPIIWLMVSTLLSICWFFFLRAQLHASSNHLLLSFNRNSTSSSHSNSNSVAYRTFNIWDIYVYFHNWQFRFCCAMCSSFAYSLYFCFALPVCLRPFSLTSFQHFTIVDRDRTLWWFNRIFIVCSAETVILYERQRRLLNCIFKFLL